MFERLSPTGQAMRRLGTAIPRLATLRENAIRRVSPEAAEFVRLANRRAWDFRVLGRAPVPDSPVFLGNWWLVPINQDSSQIPVHARERVQAIYQAGLRPKTFVIVHDAPQLLPGARKPRFKLPPLKPPVELVELAKLAWQPLLVGAAVALFVLVVGPLLIKLLVSLVIGLLSLLLIPLVLLGMLGAVLVDPALIAVTEDDFWVVIDRWWS